MSPHSQTYCFLRIEFRVSSSVSNFFLSSLSLVSEPVVLNQQVLVWRGIDSWFFLTE